MKVRDILNKFCRMHYCTLEHINNKWLLIGVDTYFNLPLTRDLYKYIVSSYNAHGDEGLFNIDLDPYL